MPWRLVAGVEVAAAAVAVLSDLLVPAAVTVARAVLSVVVRRRGPDRCASTDLRTLWAPILAHGLDDGIGFTWFCFFGPFHGLW